MIDLEKNEIRKQIRAVSGWWTTSPNDTIEVSIPPEAWEMLVIPWLLLQNSLSIKAFASTANLVNINGFVHNIVNT